MESSAASAVFIPDKTLVWVTGKVLSQLDNQTFVVEIDDKEYIETCSASSSSSSSLRPPQSATKTICLKEHQLSSLPLQNETDKNGVHDMIKLNYLHEPSILENLRRRFFSLLPYTYTGAICVAVNPYQWLSNLYSSENCDAYASKRRDELPPHVYGISTAAYLGLSQNGMNQSILVSGESGAGKTETVKLLMNHVAHISRSENSHTIDKVLKANPLLESFGNAKTTRNDNSSRFGKFLHLQFNSSSQLVGSRSLTYLLEKSRVVVQNDSERNFHIFHELLASADTSVSSNMVSKESLFLTGKRATDFRYTACGDVDTKVIEGVSDADRYVNTINSLQLVGITADQCGYLLQVLSGLLYMGEICFTGDVDGCRVDVSTTASKDAVDISCELLGLDADTLCAQLITRCIEAAGEMTAVHLSLDQAMDGRDAFVKEIYGRVFQWLVSIINSSTDIDCQQQQQQQQQQSGKEYSELTCCVTAHRIGLLDIFGFESFKVNYFEQLCINYANEKLQQKFTMDVLTTVQEEYREEDLPWDSIDYKDNSDVIELIEGKRSSILALLNEECLMPRGTNSNFQAKVQNTFFQKNPYYFSSVQSPKEAFGICHYAGNVIYSVNGFIERNKDAVATELHLLMRASTNKLLPVLFSASFLEDINSQGSCGASSAGSASRSSDISNDVVPRNRRKSFMRADTVLTKFKAQLSDLMDTVSQTNVQYVRCIKPNANRSSSEYNRRMVVDQLRCGGIIEAIKVSRAAYPYRISYLDFIKKFKCLKASAWAPHVEDDRTTVAASSAISQAAVKSKELLLEYRHLFPAVAHSNGSSSNSNCVKSSSSSSGISKSPFELGKSKVFFSQGVLEIFEEMKTRILNSKALLIQHKYNTYKQRLWFLSVKAYCIYIQSFLRCYSCRKWYLGVQRAINIAHRNIRRFLGKTRVYHLRRYIRCRLIQTWFRMKLQFRRYNVLKRGMTILVSIAKTRRQQRLYRQTLYEEKENAKLTNQLDSLRQRLEKEKLDKVEREKQLEQDRQHALEEVQEMSNQMSKSTKAHINIQEQLRSENEMLKLQLDNFRTERNSICAHSNQQGAEFKQQKEDELNALMQLQVDMQKLRQRNVALEIENRNLKKEVTRLNTQVELKTMEVSYQKLNFDKEKEEAQKASARYKLEKSVLMHTFSDHVNELEDLRKYVQALRLEKEHGRLHLLYSNYDNNIHNNHNNNPHGLHHMLSSNASSDGEEGSRNNNEQLLPVERATKTGITPTGKLPGEQRRQLARSVSMYSPGLLGMSRRAVTNDLPPTGSVSASGSGLSSIGITPGRKVPPPIGLKRLLSTHSLADVGYRISPRETSDAPRNLDAPPPQQQQQHGGNSPTTRISCSSTHSVSAAVTATPIITTSTTGSSAPSLANPRDVINSLMQEETVSVLSTLLSSGVLTKNREHIEQKLSKRHRRRKRTSTDSSSQSWDSRSSDCGSSLRDHSNYQHSIVSVPSIDSQGPHNMASPATVAKENSSPRQHFRQQSRGSTSNTPRHLHRLVEQDSDHGGDEVQHALQAVGDFTQSSVSDPIAVGIVCDPADHYTPQHSIQQQQQHLQQNVVSALARNPLKGIRRSMVGDKSKLPHRQPQEDAIDTTATSTRPKHVRRGTATTATTATATATTTMDSDDDDAITQLYGSKRKQEGGEEGGVVHSTATNPTTTTTTTTTTTSSIAQEEKEGPEVVHKSSGRTGDHGAPKQSDAQIEIEKKTDSNCIMS